MDSSLALTDTAIQLNSPKDMRRFAIELKMFIVKNKLYTNISGKNYVHVEAWQFAAASMGIFPVIESLERVVDQKSLVGIKTSSDYPENPTEEYKYQCLAKLVRISDGVTVGTGFALCTNKENKKKSFDEYAIASMAQTRAIGKASRNTFGWIMKLAGYETTPREEVVESNAESKTADNPEPTIIDIKTLVSTKLATLPAAEKVKFLRQYTSGLSDKTLSEADYRRLYAVLTEKQQ